MLTITVGAEDVFDDSNQSFGTKGGFEIQLEHSLVSLSKWESMHETPFLDKKPKTPQQLASYIECMLLTENPPGNFLEQLSEKNIEDINAYIDRKMTATWFSEIRPEPKRNEELITSELIYYWLTVYHIPFECETWHLNRLFTLIRIASLKQSKPKKMSRSEVARRNAELNARRKAELGTKG